MRLIAAILFIVLAISARPQAVYWGTGGNDTTGNGLTEATRFLTAGKALQTVNSGFGTEVRATDGVYSQSGTLILTRSGITWTAVNSNNFPPTVIITNGASSDVFRLNEVSNCVVKGITLVGRRALNSQHGVDIRGMNAMYKSNVVTSCIISNVLHGVFQLAGNSSGRGLDGAVVSHCVLANGTGVGIYTRMNLAYAPPIGSFLINCQYTDNIITNWDGSASSTFPTIACEGMLLQSQTDPYVYRNFVNNIGASCISTPGGPAGILTAFTTRGYTGWNVVGNVHRSPTSGGGDGIGFNPGPAVFGSLWEHNYAWNCDAAGYYANYQDASPPYGGSNTFRWNVSSHCGIAGAQAAAELNGSQTATVPSNDKIYQNTFDNTSSGARGMQLTIGSSGPSLIANNIFLVNGADVWTLYGQNPSGTPLPSFTSDGNIYWDRDGTTTYSYVNVTKTGIAQWRTATGKDANSVEANPLLRNGDVVFVPTSVDDMLTITNYWLPAGSAYLSAGRDLFHEYGISDYGGYDANSNAIPLGAFPIGAYGGTPPDPVITQQPQSVQVFVNSSTNFIVVASGTPTLHYQWKVNGVNQGTDSATFTTNTVLAGANSASVSVVVTGPGANSPASSANAFIQVVPDPWITLNPTNYTTAEGGSATFTMAALGATMITYAWTVGGVSQGGNSPTLTLNNVPFLFNGSSVVCNASDDNGNTNTTSVILTVYHNGPPPPYTGDPVNFTLVSALRSNITDTVQGWISYDVSYYPLTEANTNLDATRAFGQIAWFTFPIGTGSGQPFSPQTYKIYIGQATQNTNSTVIANIGDGWVTNTFGATDAVNTWTNLPNVTTSISFSNVLIGVMKRQPVGTLQNYWLAGVGVLQTNYDIIQPGVYRFIDTNAIITTNLVGAPGNLIPNSSFEFGLSPGGWIAGARNGTIGNEVWLSNMTTNDAFNGTHAAVIADGMGAARFQLNSPPIWLRGDRNIRSYVLSFYYKKGPNGPATAVVDWSRPYSSNDSGSASFSPSFSWQRFQTNLWLAPFPNRIFQFVIHHGAGTPLIIDAVQFEESTNGATAYAPADPIEVTINSKANGSPAFSVGNGNIQDANANNLGISVITYNNSANASNVVVNIEGFDWLNRRLGLGQYLIAAPPGLQDYFIFWRGLNGPNRFYSWINGSPAFRGETEIAIAPVPANGNGTTNWDSMFGTHACEGNSLVSSNLAWGISWQRGLSPGGIIQWNEIEPTIGGGMDFTSTLLKVQAINGKCVILANMSDVSDIPAWALTNGIPMLDRLSNFVFTAVNTLKPYVHFWESINEPMTFSGWSGAQFAPIETVIAGAVKAADSTAYYVGFGGTGGGDDLTKPEAAWTLLTALTKSQIDAVSVHMYPANKALWMGADDDPGPAAARALGIFCGKPVWNTESSSFMWPNYGDKNGGLQGIPSYANHNEEFNFRRSVWQAAELASRNWIRLLGYGIQKYFYYDGRLAGGRYDIEDSQSYWFNFDDSMNAVGAAYLWSTYFLDYPSYVFPMTNTASSDVFGALFAHTNGQAQVIACFTLSRSNLLMTVTNSSFATYDMMGNLVATNSSSVSIGRKPIYFVSSDLTSNQLQATFESASVSARADVTPPAVSIDVTQHGNVLQTNQLPFRFRVTLIDNWEVNTDDTPLLVKARYRFAGLTDWSAWTADRYWEMTNAPSVLTHLEVQAMDSSGNVSEVFSSPDFGPSTGPLGPFNFHISKGHVSKGHL